MGLKRVRKLVLSVVILAVASTGCGSEEERVKAAFYGFIDALTSGDREKACDLLSPSAQRALLDAGAKNCDQAIASVHRQLDQQTRDQLQEEVKVSKVAVSEDTAEVRVVGSPDESGPVQFVKVDGGWKLAQPFR